MPNVAAIVLAAGRGRRFGAGDHDSKVVAQIGNVPLVRSVTRTVLASSPRPVIVVTGHAAPSVEDALRGLPVVLVHNADYATGMAGSLRVGLAALPGDIDGALVLLADMPLVASATLDALVTGFADASPTPDAVVPSHAGRRGNPILIGRRMFDAISHLGGDVGARGLIAQAERDVLICEVDDPGILLDVDTPEALRAVRDRG